MQRVPFEEMQQEFVRVLSMVGFPGDRASRCAQILAENSLVGVASHGLNRFPDFIGRIRRGFMQPDAEPEKVGGFGAWEQWDGHRGPGPLNAASCTERAMVLAREYGMGCVALKNTTHWMRAGTYGQQAAQAGFIFLCWTNTTPNMPPWGARTPHLGNNPLVLAVPREGGPVVLDMAMSQFSYGKLETLHRYNEQLPLFGGFDSHGRLTKAPGAILESQRPLPIGYWKGSGLALLLDLTAAIISGGKTTYQIGKQSEEYDLSQVFLAFDAARAGDATIINRIVNEVLDDLHAAEPQTEGGEILYPGERGLKTRAENLAKGIPVDEEIWRQVLDM